MAMHPARRDARRARDIAGRCGPLVKVVNAFGNRAPQLPVRASTAERHVDALAASVYGEVAAYKIGLLSAHAIDQPVAIGNLRRDIDARPADAAGEQHGRWLAGDLGDLLQYTFEGCGGHSMTSPRTVKLIEETKSRRLRQTTRAVQPLLLVR